MSDKRTEKAKEDVLGKLSKQEMEIIKHRRKFDSVEKGTIDWDILVEIDPVGKQLNDDLQELEHNICLIEDGHNYVKKMQIELESGVIKTESKPGLLMTKDDLEIQIKLDKNKIKHMVRALNLGLYKIRSQVGSKDYNGTEWISLDQFYTLVNSVNDRIGKMGYKLFSRKQ